MSESAVGENIEGLWRFEAVLAEWAEVLRGASDPNSPAAVGTPV
jgi:hypothetical protein